MIKFPAFFAALAFSATAVATVLHNLGLWKIKKIM